MIEYFLLFNISDEQQKVSMQAYKEKFKARFAQLWRNRIILIQRLIIATVWIIN